MNPINCVPVFKFKGFAKDSTLLYLEKYLLELSTKNDVSTKIEKDFKIGISKHRNYPKSISYCVE